MGNNIPNIKIQSNVTPSELKEVPCTPKLTEEVSVSFGENNQSGEVMNLDDLNNFADSLNSIREDYYYNYGDNNNIENEPYYLPFTFEDTPSAINLPSHIDVNLIYDKINDSKQPESPYPEEPADDAPAEDWDKYEDSVKTQNDLRDTYGPAEGNMTAEEYQEYQDAVGDLKVIMGEDGKPIYYDPKTGEEIPSETVEVAPGVTQTTVNGYTMTEVTLYNGKTYDQLNPEQKAEIDAYNAKVKEAEEAYKIMLAAGQATGISLEEFIARSVETPGDVEITKQTHVQAPKSAFDDED